MPVLTRRRTLHKARIQHLPTNEHGRDLIVGDLHGHLETLTRALDALGFEPERDRVLSVGDLVDRGPDSAGCLALLREPWFHAVMGNHEDLLLGSVRELRATHGSDPRFAMHQNNGGEWLLRVWPPDTALAQAIERTRLLPHVLVVGAGPARYHVVHAGFAIGTTNSAIDQGELGDPEGLMWRRSLGQALREMDPADDHGPRDAAGLSTTYCGHTIGSDRHGRPLRGHGHVNLETGVAQGNRLSIAVRDRAGREVIHQQAVQG
ncbi:metallophosphoesterase [Aquisalimonas asiatica]|uniref:Serine/threonine protein phosphatase 1 n=1 Tax=Aquisalimonas asiatica TaxID=406100 RepID=A0A1H8U2U1_9GAMM|nr:metallophosphoesterase [Aquisalimonas asiatica]SEO97481.1 serine/threonine protein phosphatase 1 [Aquisalimonas asiatica]